MTWLLPFFYGSESQLFVAILTKSFHWVNQIKFQLQSLFHFVKFWSKKVYLPLKNELGENRLPLFLNFACSAWSRNGRARVKLLLIFEWNWNFIFITAKLNKTTLIYFRQKNPRQPSRLSRTIGSTWRKPEVTADDRFLARSGYEL